MVRWVCVSRSFFGVDSRSDLVGIAPDRDNRQLELRCSLHGGSSRTAKSPAAKHRVDGNLCSEPQRISACNTVRPLVSDIQPMSWQTGRYADIQRPQGIPFIIWSTAAESIPKLSASCVGDRWTTCYAANTSATATASVESTAVANLANAKPLRAAASVSRRPVPLGGAVCQPAGRFPEQRTRTTRGWWTAADRKHRGVPAAGTQHGRDASRWAAHTHERHRAGATDWLRQLRAWLGVLRADTVRASPQHPRCNAEWAREQSRHVARRRNSDRDSGLRWYVESECIARLMVLMLTCVCVFCYSSRHADVEISPRAEWRRNPGKRSTAVLNNPRQNT